MSSKERRAEKDRKAKNREKKKKRSEQTEQAKERRGITYLKTWPLLGTMHADKADPQFVALIEDAMRAFDFESIRDDDPMSLFYKAAAETHDWEKVAANIAAGLRQQGHPLAHAFEVIAVCDFGHRIFESIGEEKLAPFFPWCDVRFLPFGRYLIAQFNGLKRIKRSNRFYSPNQPKVILDGKECVLAWSVHAMQRVATRLRGGSRSYASWGDVFGFFQSMVRTDSAILYPNQPAIAVWDLVGPPPFVTFELAKACEPSIRPEEGNEYLWRTGYCPVVPDGGFALATTFLAPGWKATPEYGLILRNSSSKEKAEWDHRIVGQNPDCDSAYVQMAAQFHRWGQKQIFRPANRRDWHLSQPLGKSPMQPILPSHLPRSVFRRVKVVPSQPR